MVAPLWHAKSFQGDVSLCAAIISIGYKYITEQKNKLMKKILLSAAFVAAFATVSAQTLTYVPFTENAFMTGTTISKNGKFLGGCDTEGRAFIYNMQTGETKFFYSPQLEGGDGDNGAAVNFISNDGVGVGYLEGNATTFDFATGEYKQVVDDSSLFKYSSEDGSVVCGVTYDSNYKQYPFYMKDGVKHDLPTFTDEELGYETNGFTTVAMSADGSLIAGGPIENFGTAPMMLWRLSDDKQSYTPEYLAQDYFDGSFDLDGNQLYDEFEAAAISANGKWIAVNIHDKTGEHGGVFGRYNVEDKTFQPITCPEENDMFYYWANDISNDGTIIGYTEDQSTQACNAIICKAGETEAKYMSEVFPSLTQLTQMDMYELNRPCAITPDGRYIMGYGYTDFDEENLCYATYYIDVLGEGTGITNAAESTASNKVVATYGIDGKKLANGTRGNFHGIVLNKLANGKVVKTVK